MFFDYFVEVTIHQLKENVDHVLIFTDIFTGEQVRAIECLEQGVLVFGALLMASALDGKLFAVTDTLTF